MAAITIDSIIASILRVELSAQDLQAIINWKCVYQECLYACLGIPEADKNDETAYPFKATMLIGHLISLELVNSGALASSSSASAGDTFLKKAKAGSVEAEFGLLSDSKTSRMGIDSLYGTTLNKARGLASDLGCWVDILDVNADASDFTCYGLCAPGEAE